MAELRTRSSERLTPKITLVLQPNHHNDHDGQGLWSPEPKQGPHAARSHSLLTPPTSTNDQNTGIANRA
jgi:hypothetical protein